MDDEGGVHTFEDPGPDARAVRVPGRANLIGEHIDYLGLPVLPMALDRVVRIRFRHRTDARVRLRNTGPHGAAELTAGPAIYPADDWSDYVRAGVQAVARTLGSRQSAAPTLHGWDGVVSSDLPEAAGLASSSALVVAAAVATLDANQATVPPLELATILAEGERYVGTAGGGMDQAVCLAGRHGHALRIDFDPLRATPIPIPDDWAFVVAHSLERAEKSRAAREAYNRRSRQARDALAEVADRLRGRERRADGDPATTDSRAGSGTAMARELLADHAPDTLLAVGDRALDATGLARLRHVVTEAARVEAAERALRSADMDAFGRLMDVSHASLRDDYEVSTGALDALMAFAREAGARGARLTGAGFGGCIVALCPLDGADALMAALHREFYALRGMDDPVGAGLLFRAVPSDGARVEPVTPGGPGAA